MRAHWLGDLMVLTGLLGLFFCFGLGGRALWAPDEGRYSEVAREMVASGDYLTPRLGGVRFFEKPPLFYWTQSVAIKLFGLREWALRLGPALFALFGCLAVYYCGRTLFGRRSGVCAVIVLATSCLYYVLSRTANLDMGLTVLLTGALISFLLALREPAASRRRWVWSFFICCALAVLQKGLIGIVLPGLIIISWLAIFREWKLLRSLHLGSGAAIFAAIVLPWHIWVAALHSDFFVFYFIGEHFERFLFKHEALNHPWSYIPVLLVGFFPWSPFLYQAIRHSLFRSSRPRHGYREALFLALWAGWVFVFFSLSSSKTIAYVLPMFPPLAILLGRYFAAALDRPAVEGLRVGYAMLLAAILLLVPLAAHGPQHYFERYSNWPDLEVPADESTLPSTALTVYADLQKSQPYVIAELAILLSGVLLAIYFGKRRRPGMSFAALAATSTMFLLVLNQSLPVFDQRRSVKDLAAAFQASLKPDDEVATYHAYYQDLPLYLQRHITQVGWVESFELGQVDFNRATNDDKSFWQKWDGPRRMFVVTDRATFDILRREQARAIHVVAANDYSVVFSNRLDLPALVN
ncbi:MAG: glycosyltransferase family 39 protein [Deltaproteobacteria bacterium]|nr:glycosyltransferase family 39 protein [Deltaproteobacteria bacterium]